MEEDGRDAADDDAVAFVELVGSVRENLWRDLGEADEVVEAQLLGRDVFQEEVDVR